MNHETDITVLHIWLDNSVCNAQHVLCVVELLCKQVEIAITLILIVCLEGNQHES